MPLEINVSKIPALDGRVARFLSGGHEGILAQDKEGNFLRIQRKMKPFSLDDPKSPDFLDLPDSIECPDGSERFVIEQAVYPAFGDACVVEGNVVVVDEGGDEVVSTLFTESDWRGVISVSKESFTCLGLDVRDLIETRVEEKYTTFLMRDGLLVVMSEGNSGFSNLIDCPFFFELSLPKLDGECPVSIFVRRSSEGPLSGIFDFVTKHNIYAIYRVGEVERVAKLVPTRNSDSLELGPDVLDTQGVLGCDSNSMLIFRGNYQEEGLYTNKGSEFMECDYMTCGMCGGCRGVKYGLNEVDFVKNSGSFDIASMALGGGKCCVSKKGDLAVIIPCNIGDEYFFDDVSPMELKKVLTHEPIASAAMFPGRCRGLALTTSGSVLDFSFSGR